MIERLYKAIERALFQRWNGRLPGIRSRARRVARRGVSIEDAYMKGYREAYFDAVTDMVEEGLVVDTAVVAPAADPILDGDEVH